MKNRAATVQDVARAAGVSTATVSRAINEPDKVSEETRQRVADAIAATRYTLNEAARSLRMNRSRMLLVTVPDIGNPYFSLLLAGMEETASQQGYNLLIANTNCDPHVEHRLYDYVRSNRADGILILDGTLPSLGEQSDTALPPVVVVSERIEGAKLPTVCVDNAAALASATQHLLQLGHQRIGHLCGPLANVLTKERLAGFRQAMTNADLPVADSWVYSGDFSMDAGAAAARQWLAQTVRPTAITCANDELAFGFIDEVRRHGIRVPEQVSVVGFDDIQFAARFYPALTTIHQPRKEIGRQAAALLLDLINQPGKVKKQEIVLGTELVIRESTAAPSS